MDTRTRTDEKRCVIAIRPQAPVVFAINLPLASISSSLASQRRVAKSGGDRENRFVLRRMDSGEWSERSLADPMSEKYKGPTFTDPKKWDFCMDS